MTPQKKTNLLTGQPSVNKLSKELNRRFTEEPVLIMPDQTKPFQIKCDASKYASGAVLTQIDGNGN